MIVLMKCLNEERAVRRVISDFHDEPWVDRIIVIDGGSTDFTVHELRAFPKVEVFIHPWFDWYHDMETSQSNIALSYVPHGAICFILDFDERCSPELREALARIDREGIPGGANIAHVSRRTFDLLRHEDSPFAILDDEGWPIQSHQIGQYPDYQCRILRKDYRMRWVNSPHHVLIGWEGMQNVNIDADVIHYEKDDARDRERIERKWAMAIARRKLLGLVPDKFEVRIKPELQQFTEPEAWGWER